MCFKIIIRRQNPCPDQLLLQDVHKLQQILRMAVSNVVNCIRWNRKPVLPHLFLRGSLHHTLHSLYNIIHICKITLTVSIIENLDCLIITKFIGKSKICHIRAAGRSIHSKETKSCRWNIIQLGIGMSHQLIRLLSCRIKRHRIIHFILCGIRHLLIRTINGRTRCIYQMLHTSLSTIIRMTTSLKDIIKTNQVRLNIHIRICNRIPDSRLRSQVHYHSRIILFKKRIYQFLICNRTFYKFPGRIRMLCRQTLNLLQTVFFDGNIVIIIHIVDTDNMYRLHFSQKFHHKIRTNKTSCTGYQNHLICQHYIFLSHILQTPFLV